MFERYTEHARRVLFFSRYEASQLGTTSIEPEHVLLGILREQRGIVRSVLADAGVELDGIRSELEAATTFRERIPASIEIPFSPSCKRILQFAAEEADGLQHQYIGSEHLLLGVLREETSPAGQLLRRHGLQLADVRQRVAAPPKMTLTRTVNVAGMGHEVDADKVRRQIQAIRAAMQMIELETEKDNLRGLLEGILRALDDLERLLLG